MLKIQARYHGKNPQEAIFISTLRMEWFRESLLERGIDFGPNVANPDLILYTSASLPDGDIGNQPCVVLDCEDAGHVLDARKFLQQPAVRGVLKGSLYRFDDQYAIRCPTLRHSVILRGDLGLQPKATHLPGPWAPGCDPARVAVYCGFGHSAVLRPLVGEIFHHEPIKVFCALNHRYEYGSHRLEELEMHRELARDKVLDWARTDQASVVVGSSYGYSRAFSLVYYHTLMLMSRVVVSPWGWGEYCHRDYEALLAGCVLVKPDTSWSDTWPELVPGEHYVACKPDCSDLGAAIETALSDEWSNQERRLNLRNHVLRAWDHNVVAERFANIVKRWV